MAGTYIDGPAGRAAVTRHQHGTGHGRHVSTAFGRDELASVLTAVYRDAGIVRCAASEGLEVVVRHGSEADFLIASFAAPGRGRPLANFP